MEKRNPVHVAYPATLPNSPHYLAPVIRITDKIAKPRSQWTVDDITALVREEKVRIISLMHIGGDGWLKTLDFAPRDAKHLRDVLLAGERADGSSIFAGMGIPAGKSDIVLRPRLDSAFFDPFSSVPTLILMCNHYGRDGALLPESPDTILRKAYHRLQTETGIELNALGEVEYYLGKVPLECEQYGASDRGYHSTSPFVFGEALRRHALVILNEMGIPVKYGHSEVGYIEACDEDPNVWEQHEIELALQPLPLAAESVVLTQWVLRNLAHLCGMQCSFAPVVRKGHAGSGMHFHMSPVRNGEHLSVNGETDELRDVSKWLIGGLVQMGGVLMAFGNRDKTSFLRLTQAKEAPNAVTWGRYNRKALIRLPIVASDAEGNAVTHETIEYRLPDGSAHPQLLLAGIAQSMLLGKKTSNLDEWIARTAAEAASTENGKISVPKSYSEVAESLQQNAHVFTDGGVFPEHIIDRWVENLRSQA